MTQGNVLLCLMALLGEVSWFGDEVILGIFRYELMLCDGNITIWINNPGEDGTGLFPCQFSCLLFLFYGKITVMRVQKESQARQGALCALAGHMQPIKLGTQSLQGFTVLANGMQPLCF